MTIEYVLLLIIGGVVFMSVLMKAPRYAFDNGGARLASRTEAQMATGLGFTPYPKGSTGDDKRVQWSEKE
ncbi:MAG: hypothetical protein ACXVAX_00250 [Pseudobdellovibrio sp.]